jgi:hypothetical protein
LGILESSKPVTSLRQVYLVYFIVVCFIRGKNFLSTSLISTPSVLRAARIPHRIPSLGLLEKSKQKYREPCHKPPLRQRRSEPAPCSNGEKEREKYSEKKV